MIIIQLLKDTKYPANYQIIIDSSLGNYAVLRDFFSALGRGRGRLVELVLDEELDGLVFCHSEFVVEDCGVVVSLLCAEPEFSLV